jgi:hypothetical protein
MKSVKTHARAYFYLRRRQSLAGLGTIRVVGAVVVVVVGGDQPILSIEG